MPASAFTDGQQAIKIHDKSNACGPNDPAMRRRAINPVEQSGLRLLCIRVYFAL
jgi:hypothetical protein